MQVTADNVGRLTDQELNSMMVGGNGLSSLKSMLKNAKNLVADSMRSNPGQVIHNHYIDHIYREKEKQYVINLKSSHPHHLTDLDLACALLRLRYDAETEFLHSYS